MQHDSRLKAIEHAQRIDQAAACGLHLVVCAINGSPTFISILPPLLFLDTNNNLVHGNFPQKVVPEKTGKKMLRDFLMLYAFTCHFEHPNALSN